MFNLICCPELFCGLQATTTVEVLINQPLLLFLLASFVAPFAAQNFASKYVKIVQIEPFLRSLSLVGVEDF